MDVEADFRYHQQRIAEIEKRILTARESRKARAQAGRTCSDPQGVRGLGTRDFAARLLARVQENFRGLRDIGQAAKITFAGFN